MRKTRHERSWKSVQISARTKIASGRILWRGPLSGKNQKNQQKESASGGKRRRPDSVPPRSRNRAKPTGPGQTNTKEKCDLRADFTEQRDSSVATGPRHAHRKSQIQQHGTRKTSTSKWGTTSLTKQNANQFFSLKSKQVLHLKYSGYRSPSLISFIRNKNLIYHSLSLILKYTKCK
jgi:hypothetical protein